MFTTKIHKIIVGLTLLVMLFLPNCIYANSASENFYKSGNVYIDKDQYDLAIAEYTKAISLDPQYAKAYHNRGLAYYQKLQYQLALADYNKALQLNPQYDLAYYNRGNVYKVLGKDNLAIADYNQAIALNPNDADYYLMRAGAYSRFGQDRAAVDDCNQVLKMSPNNSGACNIKRDILERRGAYEDPLNREFPGQYPKYNYYSMSRVNDPSYNPL